MTENPESLLDQTSNPAPKMPFLRLKVLENKGIGICQSVGNAATRPRIASKSITARTHPNMSLSARVADDTPEESPAESRATEDRTRRNDERPSAAGRERRTRRTTLPSLPRGENRPDVSRRRRYSVGLSRLWSVQPQLDLLGESDDSSDTGGETDR